jgi:MoaA/NifB/PqqE/SkfB family radical SAM enzyme
VTLPGRSGDVRSHRTAPHSADARRASALDLQLPAICDFSVTNVCNAACDFCGFSRDQMPVGPRRHVDADMFAQALPILYRRGIRYMTLQGGEPLVHPEIVALVSAIAGGGIRCA